MPDFETIRWDLDRDRGVGRVVLDRPDVLNAMDERTYDAVAAAFERFEEADREGDGVTVRAVVLRGAGEEAFSTGADVSGFGDTAESRYPHVDRRWNRMMDAVAGFDAPVVAQVDGYCVGGGLELALACDFRLASERSEFGFPEVDIGLFPSGGGTQRLTPLVGPSRAKELCMTGAFVDGATAAADGLVDRCVPAADLDDEVEAFVDTLASKPPLSVRAVKDAVDRSLEVGLRQGLAYEHAAAIPLLETEDYREGVEAFEEGRDPEWAGR